MKLYIKLFLGVVIVGYSVGLQGQSTGRPMESLGNIYAQYPFLNESENTLLIPSEEALKPFFGKLRLLEKNKNQQVHILHIGDSHIQADLFSGRVRDLFQNDVRFPVNSRGFAFPYAAAQTNNPQNYQVEYFGDWQGKRSVKSKQFSRWGLAGVNAITFDANASITINPNVERDNFEIRKIKVFYPIYDAKSFQVEVKLEEGNSIISYSLGDGFVEFTLKKVQKAITITLNQENEEQSQFILQGVFLESNRPGLIYSASGANGAEVPTYFRCQDFYKQLAQVKPDLLVISLGTNDAFKYSFNSFQFKADYKKMLLNIKKMLPQTAVLLTTVGDSYRGNRLNKNNEKANQMILDLSKELNIAVWDFYRVMGGFQSIDQWNENGFTAKDRLHLSKQGYELQGELFYKAFDKAYVKYCATNAK